MLDTPLDLQINLANGDERRKKKINKVAARLSNCSVNLFLLFFCAMDTMFNVVHNTHMSATLIH